MADEKVLYFNSDEVGKFLRTLQEATRATPDGSRSVYIPPVGGDKAEADYHHLVFGQRGSGKSTLLRRLQQEKSTSDQLSIWVDQEIFSNLAFPDVLVSSVEAVIEGARILVEKSIAEDRSKLPWWRKLIFRPSIDKRDLKSGLDAVEGNLRALKFAAVESIVEWTRSHKATSAAGLAGTVKIRDISVGGKIDSETEKSVQSKETVASSKGEYLERALPDFRKLLRSTALIANGGFIFLDDVYYIKRSDQPKVLGYMHRLVKDTGFWLKIGSIRYLTTTYTTGQRPTGMQASQDAHLVALDDGMLRLQTSSRWLKDVLSGLAQMAKVDIEKLFNEGSLDRLALASGCIARDYLTIAGAAIEEARNRPPTVKSGMHRVTIEDVNRAAGVLAPAKLDDMQQDAPEQAAESRLLINQLTAFCLKTRRAYFQVDSGDRQLVDQLEALRHLRFVHLLARSEADKYSTAKRYDAWLLDVSQLAAQRATQQMDFNGWENREKRRSARLVFNRPDSSEAVSLEEIVTSEGLEDEVLDLHTDPIF